MDYRKELELAEKKLPDPSTYFNNVCYLRINCPVEGVIEFRYTRIKGKWVLYNYYFD